MEFTSEYYKNLDEILENYSISKEAAPFVADAVQSLEEMLFGFRIYLIS